MLEKIRAPTISSRAVAQGHGWTITDVVCRAGPEDRPYEEQHGHMSIAAVLSGTFRYRAASGTALLHPGALLLGNAGTCFECGHQHGRGDRCMAFHIDRALFEEVAASAAGSSRLAFGTPMMPAMPELLPTLVEIEALSERARRMAAESLVIRLVERVSEALSGAPRRTVPARGDERRISIALRHIERHADEALDLDSLAGLAAMSKYHFLRTFRRVTGLTPYKYLLGIRMRRAAVRLATSDAPVAAIAFDAGFGDLSTFNNRFRDLFGATPTKFRAAA
ncbi:MAG: helix-turn-helix transcriptional regulator [Alphaproteobacteria bacterium]|nr:helix-turn-helix transcriptional regulator [Alphaproteobacteria bacterium]